MAKLTAEERSERSRKAYQTRRENQIAEEKRKQQEEKNVENRSKKPFPWWLLLLLLALAALVLVFWKPVTGRIAAFLAAPTAAPTEPAPVVQATKAPVVEASVCPTTGEAQEFFGVSVQRIDTESCGWVWRGKPSSHTALCPAGYICTWDVVGDITVVHLGINQQADIYAGTWRLISAYPADDAVNNVCELYLKEKDFASREVPSFEVRFQPVPDLGPQTCP